MVLVLQHPIHWVLLHKADTKSDLDVNCIHQNFPSPNMSVPINRDPSLKELYFSYFKIDCRKSPAFSETNVRMFRACLHGDT